MAAKPNKISSARGVIKLLRDLKAANRPLLAGDQSRQVIHHRALIAVVRITVRYFLYRWFRTQLCLHIPICFTLRTINNFVCVGGLNALLLRAAGRSHPDWFTRRQIEQAGATIVKGSRPSIAAFWTKPEAQDRSTLLFYPLWCRDQLVGAPAELPLPEAPGKCFGLAEALIKSMPNRPKITRTGTAAYYSPDEDRVNIPKISTYADLSEYYATGFHELDHSTRHASRLGRAQGQQNKALNCGQCDFSREELVAEITTAMLCAEVGIKHQTTTDAAGWAKVLQADEKLLIHASAAAQKAADFVLGKVPVQQPAAVAA